ncbi:MAG: endolytic transglycosylase MltG [Hyphomicrobiaceae bacterium]
MRFLNALLTLLFVLTLAGGVGVFWLDRQFDAAGPLTQSTRLLVRRGEGAQVLAKRLEEDGVVRSQALFLAHYYTRRVVDRLRNRSAAQIKAGEYVVEPRDSVRKVLDMLNEGRAQLYSVTIPEGLTSHQVVERLKADQGLTGEIAAVPPEGSLLADTFKVQHGATRQSVIELMQSEQSKVIAELWSARAPELPLKSPAEAIVLASIVQREMGPNDDPERIAAVFLNRLRKGVRLQSDPTILYGMFGGVVPWGRPIYRSDIQQKSVHNTYQIDGLPPTAISNPGRHALRAVLKPAATNDLYFVADGKGGHVFSATLAEHNQNVAKWRVIEREIRARQKLAASEGAKRNGAAGVVAAVPGGGTGTAAQAETEGTAAGEGSGEETAVPLPERRPARR